MKFDLGNYVNHAVDKHLTRGVVIAVLMNDFYKVAWLGLDFVSVVHADFLDSMYNV